MVRHRQQIDGLGDAATVIDALEDRQRLVVARDSRMWVFAVDMPVPNPIQAMGNEPRFVDRPRHLEGVSAKLAGALVVAGRPQHAQRVQRSPLGAAVAALPGRGECC